MLTDARNCDNAIRKTSFRPPFGDAAQLTFELVDPPLDRRKIGAIVCPGWIGMSG